MPTRNARVAIELYVDDNGTTRVREFSDKSGAALDDLADRNRSATGRIRRTWAGVRTVWLGIAAGAAAAAAAVSALVITSANEAKELENLARLAKMGSREFSQYAYATESVGISADQLADISKDVQDKLGDFIATGGGEFADFFEDIAPKVGLTAQELQKLSGPEVLVAMKRAMDDANVSAAEQVFYLEAVGNDASKLIPLLKDNGKGLREMAERASELGVGLSEVDNKNLVEAGKATREATTAFGAMKNAVAAELAPVFGDFMHWAAGLLVDFKDKARSAAGAFANVFESAKGWKAVFQGKLSFFEFATMNAEEFGEWLEKNKKSTAELTNENIKAGAAQEQFGQQVDKVTLSLRQQAEQKKKLIEDAKKEATERKQSTREMYQEAGLGADQYFSDEAQKLVEKASKWKKAGADTLQVEEWLYTELGKLSEEAWKKGEDLAGVYLDNMQSQTQSLTDEFDKANQLVHDKTEEMLGAAKALDGTDIGLSVSFDGSAAYQGLDALMAKLRTLQGATASAQAGTNPFNESTDEWVKRIDGGSQSNTTNVYNFSPQTSRSDAVTIINESQRLEDRS